jgi:hypothetical protein
VTSVDRMYSCWFSMKNVFLDHVCAVFSPLLDFVLDLDLRAVASVLDSAAGFSSLLVLLLSHRCTVPLH